jgi:DNA-binding response OmpR family regulator
MHSAGKALLIVEDDDDWTHLIRLWLKAGGYKDARYATGAKQALRLARSRAPDCVVCDLQLGDGSGTEVVKQLRLLPEAAGVPVVMMTNFGAEKANCLRSGADHFIAKSPNGEEFLAVLESVFRRRDLDARLRRRGDLAFRDDTREIFVEGRPAAQLTPKTYELFMLLIERAPVPVPRDELFRLVDNREDPSLSRALDILVNRLRKSLPEAIGRRIRAVRGFGYAYVLPG